MPGLSLSLLGTYEATLDDQPLAKFPTVRAQALLIYLAAEAAFGAGSLRREALVELLWPGMPQNSGRKNLRQTMYYLRQTIGDRPAVEEGQGDIPFLNADRYTVAINRDYGLIVDVAQFLERLSAPKENWPEAVELYRGDFLTDFYLDDSSEFEDWLLGRREYLRRRALEALETLTIQASQRRAYDEARRYAERQLKIDNLRERAHRQLMEILVRSGYREEALAQYEILVRVLAEELGMEPSARSSELYRRIVAGEMSFEVPLAQDVRGFELKEQIGQGAFGTVHRAIQPAVNRDVAVKVIRQKYADDPAFIRRFEAEAQMVAQLEHPYIVPLYDFWRDPDGAYLVMRYMRGGDLRTHLKDGPWQLKPSLRLLGQISAALSVAHRQEIVHRDIKPANILFDREGNAYLTDFGIAKSLDEEQMNETGAVMGTPEYISPEQIKDEPAGPQTDIYSLGLVMYELLTGEKPFGESSKANLLYKHLHDPLPLVSASRPELPVQIDQVIRRATAKKPADRYASALEMEEAFRAAASGVEIGPFLPGTEAIELANPYKGLRAFQEADAEEFFGREKLVEQLLGRLEESRFLALVGPSGSGKSSAIKAGLIPALRQGALPGSGKWFVAEMTPGVYPFEELEKALWPIAVDPPPSLVEPMRRDREGLLHTIRRILPDEQGAELLLVIDQFEELFTTVVDERRRALFIDGLLTAMSDPLSPLRVVVTLRADFYDRPLQVQPLGSWLKENTEVVLPMSPDEVAEAIQKPAQRVGIGLEQGLLTTIVSDVNSQPGGLPLLQYALTELFDRRSGGLLTRAAYEEIGGVAGAVGRRAEELFAGLDGSEREAARQMFLRLVTLGEGVEDTRRRVQRSELETIQTSGVSENLEVFDAVVDAFGRARLLTFDRDPLTRKPTVEVAHEALLREWDRLRGWLDESRNDIRLQRLLALSAREWSAAGEDESYLLSGSRLNQYDGWLGTAGLALTQEELAFLEASQAVQKRREAEEQGRRQKELEAAQKLAETEKNRAEEQAQAAQTLRRRALYLGGALVIAAILAVAAIFAGVSANQNATLAEEESLARATQQAVAEENAGIAVEEASRAERSAAESQSLALASGAQVALRDGNTDQALALAVAANQVKDPPAFSQRLLYEAATGAGTIRRIEGGGGWRWSLDIDPSGRTVASGADDASITLWDIDTGQELIRLEGHSEPIGDIAFTPDGKQLLSGAYDDTFILWAVETGQVIRRFENPSGDVNRIDISPDGSTVIAATEGGINTLWDLESGQMIGTLEGHDPQLQVLTVTFNPDGTLAASGSEDGSVILWDVAQRSILQRLEGHTDIVIGLAFSPDGRTLASSSFDNSIILWDVAGGEILNRLTGHTDFVFDVAFNSDGSQLLSASRDSTLILWDVASGQPLHSYPGEGGRALNVAFLDDARAISSASSGNLRVWALEGTAVDEGIPSFEDPINSFAQSPNGKMGAAGLNGEIRLINLEEGQLEGSLIFEGGEVTALAFHPDGDKLLSANKEGTIILWNVQTGQELDQYEGHDLRIHDLTFSPDGGYFLSASDDQTMAMWDLATGDIVHRFDSPTDTINAVAFSPDGRTMAAGYGTFRYEIEGDYQDNNIHLWDVATEEEMGQFSGHEGPVVSLAFSPDGSQLLSGSIDNTVRLWDVDSGREVRRFDGHNGGIFSLAFSPDGATFVSGSQDASVILWQTESGELLRRLDDLGGSVSGMAFDPEGERLWLAAGGQIRSWAPILDLDQLLEWTVANRYVRDLTCSEQELYQVGDGCG